MRDIKYLFLIILLVACFFLSFMIGTYPITPKEVWQILYETIVGVDSGFTDTMRTVVLDVRLPRIIIAILAGGALSLSGTTFQVLFQNPMVSPDILGVSAGAGFGAALGLLIGMDWFGVQAYSLLFGIIAVSITYIIGRFIGNNSILIFVLSGIVISSFFQALLSIIKTMADTENVLPSITYWLMGSLEKVSLSDMKIIVLGTIISFLMLFFIRNKVDALSMGEDVANTMGVSVKLLRFIMIISSTLLTISTVSLCGIIGWIGIVVPHISRFFFGVKYWRTAIGSYLIGAIFLLMMDSLIRGVSSIEVPIGVITALVGSPIFVWILFKERRRLI